MPKSSYYEWEKKLQEVNTKEAKDIERVKRVVEESKRRYGYRRVCLQLKKEGIIMNHKRVLRIMKENNLLCNKYGLRRKAYSSYKGNVGKVAKNNLNRDFYVDKMIIYNNKCNT